MGYIKTWDELTIKDNFLFQKVMQNKRLCKKLIEKILQIKITDITYPEYEKTVKVEYKSKGIRLDVYVKDEHGVVYDIEMQTTGSPELELPKRTRYYQGLLDMDAVNTGELYTELKNSYIIFICTFDPFRQSKSIYTFHNYCKEDKDLSLEDGTTKLFLNTKGSQEYLDDDIAAFLDYVDGKAPRGFALDFDKAVHKAKSYEEWRHEYMTYEMEMRMKRNEWMKEGKLENMVSLIKQGLLSMENACKANPDITYDMLKDYAKKQGVVLP